MPIYMNWGGDVDPPNPPKIRGNATDQDHPNWIELDSIKWGTASGVTPHSTWPHPTVAWGLGVNRDLGG